MRPTTASERGIDDESTTNRPTNEQQPRREGLAPRGHRPRNDVTITTAFTTHDPPGGLRRSPADPPRSHLAIHRDTGGTPRYCPRRRVVSAGRRVRAGDLLGRGRRRGPPTATSRGPRPDGSGSGAARRPGAFRDRAAIAPLTQRPADRTPFEQRDARSNRSSSTALTAYISPSSTGRYDRRRRRRRRRQRRQ